MELDLIGRWHRKAEVRRVDVWERMLFMLRLSRHGRLGMG
jgi:hypothetical protein